MSSPYLNKTARELNEVTEELAEKRRKADYVRLSRLNTSQRLEAVQAQVQVAYEVAQMGIDASCNDPKASEALEAAQHHLDEAMSALRSAAAE